MDFIDAVTFLLEDISQKLRFIVHEESTRISPVEPLDSSICRTETQCVIDDHLSAITDRCNLLVFRYNIGYPRGMIICNAIEGLARTRMIPIVLAGISSPNKGENYIIYKMISGLIPVSSPEPIEGWENTRDLLWFISPLIESLNVIEGSLFGSISAPLGRRWRNKPPSYLSRKTQKSLLTLQKHIENQEISYKIDSLRRSPSLRKYGYEASNDLVLVVRISTFAMQHIGNAAAQSSGIYDIVRALLL